MIKRPGPSAPQKEITLYLEKTRKERGLQEAMNELHLWSLSAGYINRDKLEKNSVREFYDLDYDLSFSYQINYARAGYQQTGRPPLPEGAECLICRENGSSKGKESLRVFDIDLPGVERKSPFFLQLTPFPLFPRHFVLINREHSPMKMDARAIDQCLAMVDMTPEYTVCSNSDMEWAGASILSHSHFQLLHKRRLPVMNASPLFSLESGSETLVDVLNFPMPSLRLMAEKRDEIIREGDKIIEAWKRTAVGFRTVNMLFYRDGGQYAAILILRDSRNRNPEELQKYKSEGIGVVEAAGSWVFPPPEGYPEEELTKGCRDIIRGFFKGIRAFDPVNTEGYDFLPYKRKDNE